MKIALRWLAEFLPLELSTEALVGRLTMAGLEVEGVEQVGSGPEWLAGARTLVTGRILSRERHPNADKLSLCQVDVGDTTLSIVCGASNMGPGDVVPVARIGTVLPGPFKIEKAKLRGQWSEGMLCSARELGLSEDHSGLLILPEGTPVGVPVADLLGQRDTVLELSVTPNRADCLSVLGVARELAALFDQPLKTVAPHFSSAVLGGRAEPAMPKAAEDHTLVLEVRDSVRCPLYLGRVLTGVKVGPSPRWLVERLTAVGLRSINNVVDATNYILMERGQPLHAFDLSKVDGGRVVVRVATPGEALVCLDGVSRTLRETDLVICDAVRPMALAGVMGGQDSAVQDSTTSLLLEAAIFAPGSVRASARRAGLHTDASHRFERGVDPQGVESALDALTALILGLAGGQVQGQTLSADARPARSAPLRLEPARVTRLLGMEIPRDRMELHLRALGMEVQAGGECLWVVPPSWRLDIKQAADLAEEVVRVEGYQHIPTTVPQAALRSPAVGAEGQLVRRLQRRLMGALSGAGLDQVVNFSFVSPQSLQGLRFGEADARRSPVRLMNPISEEISVLRTLLLPSLLKNAVYNTRKQWATLRLFEVGKVFLSAGEGVRPVEALHVGVLLTGPRASRSWTVPSPGVADLYDLKGALEAVFESFRVDGWRLVPDDGEPFLAPGQGWRVVLSGEQAGVGWFGQLHPEVMRALGLEEAFAFELKLEPVWAARGATPRFAALPRFPALERDLAFLVPEGIEAGAILEQIRACGGDLLEQVTVFDVYRGKGILPGMKSMAFGLTWRSPERTLMESEVVERHDGLFRVLKDVFGAQLRS